MLISLRLMRTRWMISRFWLMRIMSLMCGSSASVIRARVVQFHAFERLVEGFGIVSDGEIVVKTKSINENPRRRHVPGGICTAYLPICHLQWEIHARKPLASWFQQIIAHTHGPQFFVLKAPIRVR